MQNLQLLLHIPDRANFDADSTASWQLFDRQSGLLRSGEGRLAQGSVPHAEHTVIVIPAARIVCIETPLPPVSAQKRDALLRYAIEDKLTIDPATVHAVVLGTSASPKTNTHVVAAVDRAWFASVLRWLRIGGIDPAQAVSSAAMIPVATGDWGVTLEGEHGLARRPDGFAYSFDVSTHGGKPGGSGTRPIPLEPPFALALALKEARDQQASPARLNVFVDQSADQVVNANWVDAWQRVLGVPVQALARPAARMVKADAGNLLTGEFAPRSSARDGVAFFKPALAIIALIALLHTGLTVIDAWRLDARRRALEAQMTQVFKEAFPKAQAIVDPALQMQRNLGAMKREAGLDTTDSARTALATLSAILKTVPGLIPQSVTIRDDSASMEVAVPTPAQQALLRSRAAATRGATFAVNAGNIVSLAVKADR